MLKITAVVATLLAVSPAAPSYALSGARVAPATCAASLEGDYPHTCVWACGEQAMIVCTSYSYTLPDGTIEARGCFKNW